MDQTSYTSEDKHGHNHGHNNGHGHGHKHGHSHGIQIDDYDGGKSKPYLNLRKSIKIITSDKESRKNALFAITMFFLAIFECWVGSRNESLSMLAAGFFSAFDGLAVGIALISYVVSKSKQTVAYSFGFERFEVLSVFTNAILMIFVSLYVVFESFEKFFEPAEIEVYTIRIVSMIGIAVHTCGIVFFHEQINMRDESIIHPSRHDLAGYVYYAMDVVPVLNSFLVSWFAGSLGWYWADMPLSLVSAGIMAYKAYPTCIATGRILLQSVPLSIKHIVEQNLRDASTVEGVLEIHNTHFWTYSPGVFVGSLYVRVRSDSNEQSVLRQIRAIYSPYIKYLTIQIEKWNVIDVAL